MKPEHTWGDCHQFPAEDYLEKMREIYVPAVNDKEPWRAVRWGSEELQSKRLEVMDDILSFIEFGDYEWNDALRYESILDVGCGRGELIRVVKLSQGDDYLGIDVVPEMVDAAERTWPNMKFECHDLRDEPRPADAVIASGIFCITNDEIFFSMLDAMWDSAKVLMAFNVKSSWAPKDCPSVGGIGYYRDPAETLSQ